MVCFFLFAWLKDANIVCIARSVEAGAVGVIRLRYVDNAERCSRLGICLLVMRVTASAVISGRCCS